MNRARRDGPAAARATRRGLALCVVLWGIAGAAHAQFKECDKVGLTPGYKFVVYEVMRSSNPQLRKDLADILEEELNKKMKQFRLESNTKFGVVTCADRNPTASDFSDDATDSLNSQDVLTVLWGAPASGMLRLGHLLVPYRYELSQAGHQGEGGVFYRSFNVSGASTTALVQKLSDEDFNLSFKGYFSLAVGLKMLKGRRYALALSYLCAAKDAFRRSDQLSSEGTPPEFLEFLDAKLAQIWAIGDVARFVSQLPADQRCR